MGSARIAIFSVILEFLHEQSKILVKKFCFAHAEIPIQYDTKNGSTLLFNMRFKWDLCSNGVIKETTSSIIFSDYIDFMFKTYPPRHW